MDGNEGTVEERGGRIVKGISSFFLRLSIAKKMFVGYIALVGLLVIISVFTLTNFNTLNSLNKTILEIDVPIVEASDRLVDALLAQEVYIRRYAILKTPDLLKVFWERSREFDRYLDVVRSAPADRKFPIEEIEKLHRQFNDFIVKGMNKLENPSKPAARKFDSEVKSRQEEIITLVKGIALAARADQNEKTALIADIGRLAFRVAAILCIAGFILSVAAAIFITVNISNAVNKLKLATEKIAEGDFDCDPDIRNKDEVGDLSIAFVAMAKRLKKLEEMYIDASPLTRLPGGIAIENILKKRLQTGGPLAFCLLDLDHFKAFNDHYGYAKGNELIVRTAQIISDAVETLGTEEDFVGHIGGDDFAVITRPDKYAEVCRYITQTFDREAPAFYDEEDRARGYIEGVDRHGNARQFPIATISIAIVTNLKREIKNHLELGEIAAELKEYAKTLDGSVYVVDHRRSEKRGERENPVTEEGGEPEAGKVVEFKKKRRERKDRK